MPKRKKFEDLSDRQKRRRISQFVTQKMEELSDEVELETGIFANEESCITIQNLDSTSDIVQQPNLINLPNVRDDLPYENTVDCENNHTINTNNLDKSAFHVEPDFVDDLSRNKDEYEQFLRELDFLSEEMELDYFMTSDEEDLEFDVNNSASFDTVENDESSSDDERSGKLTLKDSLKEWKADHFITRDAMNDLLAILRTAGHDDLPKDSRSLSNFTAKTIVTPCPPGEYFHYGIEQSLKDLLDRSNLSEDITINTNIDGLPITKSTKRTLWVIQGKVDSRPDLTPFVIGVYHGTNKPESARVFLTPFVEECKKLISTGFTFKKKNYNLNLGNNILDLPAASFCTCTKQHNGYFGCRKCMEEGDWRGRMVYLVENAPLRTDDNFRKQENEDHHLHDKGRSPFEDLTVNMVLDFPIDYMHLVCLGGMKLLIKIWLKLKPALSPYELIKLDEAFMNLSKYVPKEFNRKPQSFKDLGHWKATVYRFFLLYAGPIILNGIIPDECIKHFNLLSCAIRILCHPEDFKRNNKFAEDLLLKFVKIFKTLYSEDYVTINVHMLIHLAADANRIGPLDTFSAFPFENYMSFVKKLLRKNEKPLQQIHRRLAEKHYPSNKRKAKYENYPVLTTKLNTELPLQCHSAYKRLQFLNFELTIHAPDNCCILSDKKIVLIEHIGKKNNEIKIIGREFKKKQSLKNYPIDSTRIGISQVSDLSKIEVYDMKTIQNKACLFFHKNKTYVTPLLHH